MRLVIDLDEPAGKFVFEVSRAEAAALADPSKAPGKMVETAYEYKRMVTYLDSAFGGHKQPATMLFGIPTRVVDR